MPTAHIPSILTAAGTTVAFATIYAAYALYDFLVPGTAFVLLGIVALATLAASLLHGPALAALGQIGAFVTPMLIASRAAELSGRSTSTSRSSPRPRSRSHARGCGAGSPSRRSCSACCGRSRASTTTALRADAVAFYLVVGFALAAALLVSGLLYGPGRRSGPDRSGLLGRARRLSVRAAMLVLARDHDAVALTAFTLLAVATVAIAWRTDAAVAAVPIAGALAALVIADWAVEIQWTSLDRGRRSGGRARSLARALRGASRARRLLRGAVRRRRLPRAGPLVARRKRRSCGPRPP